MLRRLSHLGLCNVLVGKQCNQFNYAIQQFNDINALISYTLEIYIFNRFFIIHLLLSRGL